VALAIVLGMGLVAPFIPEQGRPVVLMDESGRIVAEGDATERDVLELLQEQNQDVRLVERPAGRALDEMRELVRPQPYPTLCMVVPPGSEWDVEQVPAGRSVSRPCRALRGCGLAIRHYG